MDLAIQNADRMVEKLERIIGVKQTRLESIKRLQRGGRNRTLTFTPEEEVKLALSKHELIKEIGQLQDDQDEWARQADHHREVESELDLLIGAIQERDELHHLTRKEQMVKILTKDLGW